MAIRKFRRGTRRFRKPYYRRRGTYKLAKRAAKSVLWKQSETKYIDYTWTNSNILYKNVIELLQYIQKGTSRNQRVGNQVKVIGLRYQFTFVGRDVDDHIRFMIALPKNMDVSGQDANWPDVNQPLKTELIRALRDTNVTIDAETGNTQRVFKGKIKFPRGRMITFNTELPTLDKPLCAYFTCNVPGLLSYPRLYGYVRVYYKDI